jgi:hypothetical protein
MVEMKRVLDSSKYSDIETQLFKAVKDLSKEIGESSGTSTFITAEDALSSGSDIFLIKKDEEDEEPVIRKFILV